MRRYGPALGRTLFGAALVAALGFGATQAFAETPQDPSAGAARACDHNFCNNYCIGAGYYGGSCVSNGMGGTKCLCY
ncbi:MAG TPA: hypothetical protein VF746_31185 [Longimicrobium sp.]|jgi:hypothetical protein